MILILDNYDSFVHNLARYVRQLGEDVRVVRNDAISLSQINAMGPSHIILSPGPCGPLQAGICLDVVKAFYQRIPILGVCLGHQVIGAAFSGKIARAREPLHGKAGTLLQNGHALFAGLPKTYQVGRYHSLIVEEQGLSKDLTVIACSPCGEVMALAHRHAPLIGVQFHPESLLTEHGYALLQNFLKLSANHQPSAWCSHLDLLQPKPPLPLRYWLAGPKQLIQALRQHYQQVKVRVLQQDWRDENFVREVIIECDGEPFVYAITQFPRATYEAFADELTGLGEGGLGDHFLYQRPDCDREPFEFCAASDEPLLTTRAQEIFGSLTGTYARRSLFHIDGYSLSVAEMFHSEC